MTQILHSLQSKLPASVSILGVRVDCLTQRQTIAYIESFLQHYIASNRQALCQQIMTVNPEFVMAAQHDAQFRRCINKAALVVPDGMGIVWAARFLGKPVPERVTGIDTVIESAKRCAMQGYRLYLLGAAPGIAELAAARLQ